MDEQHVLSFPFIMPNRNKNLSNRTLLALCILYLLVIYNLTLLNVISDFNFFISHSGRILLACVALFLIFNKSNLSFLIKNKHYVFYLLIFFIVVLIGSFFTSDFHSTLNRIIFDIVGCWIIYLSFMLLCKDPKNQKIIAWALAILATINGIVALYGALTGKMIVDIPREKVGVGAFGFDLETGRSGGFRGENYMGAWNAPSLGLGLILLFEKSYWLKFIGSFFALIASTSLIVSLSRTSVIAGIILITIITTYIIGRKKIINLVIFLIFSLLAFQVAKNIFIAQSMRFSPYLRYETQRRWTLSEMLENERKHIWISYLNVSLEAPIFGHGAGFIKNELDCGNYVPHNSFLDVLVEHGISGLILYFLPFIISFKKLNFSKRNNNMNKMSIFYFASFMAIAISLLFLSNPFFKLLWLVMGCLEGVKKPYIKGKGNNRA